jgi:hypothetical protein
MLTWEEAEKITPGITEDWQLMIKDAGQVYCPTPEHIAAGLHLELGIDKPSNYIRIVMNDPEGVWYCPPEWRYWGAGRFTFPFPITKRMHEAGLRYPDP